MKPYELMALVAQLEALAKSRLHDVRVRALEIAELERWWTL